MRFDQIVMLVMAVFLLLGGADRAIGNRLRLGAAFERGVVTVGQLMLSMTGILVLCPVLASVLQPVIVPVFRFLGADPAICAGSLFACDMGGAQLAEQLAQSAEAAGLGGIVVSSMLGVTVSFTIPVAMSVLKKDDRPAAAKGILCGVMTIPVGMLLGGLAMGCETGMLLRNMTPVLLLVALIALGLWKAERQLIRGFEWFAKGLVLLSTVGLAAGGFEWITGVVLIPGLASMEEAFVIVGGIGVVLAGAFPLMQCVNRLLRKPIARLGARLRMNDQAVSGLITTLANSIATFDMIGDMDARGKVVNMAFAVSGAFVLGDHLAFTAGYNAKLITALIVGKLSAGAAAVALALVMTRKRK